MATRVCLILVGLVALWCAPAASADTVPEYFHVPAPFNSGTGIAAAPDGTVWFAANPPGSPAPTLGRLIPSEAAPGTANGMATFPTPTKPGTSCCANQLRSVAFDAANNRLWFVQSDGIVGWADPGLVVPGTSTGIQDVLLSTPLTSGGNYTPDLADVAIGANGLAWFTERSSTNVAPYPGGRIGSIDATFNVSENENIALQGGRTTLDSLRYDSKPFGITTDSSGVPWFTESDPGNPGYRIARGSGSGYIEYLIQPCGPGSPCSGSFTGTGPTDVAVAPDGSIWFTNQLKNEVGRLDLAGSTFTNYSLPAIDVGLTGGQARAITTAPDGTLWVAEFGGATASANAIIRIVPSQPTPTATVFHLGAGRMPFAVAPDTRGNIWFALSTNTAPGMIGRLAGVLGAAPPPGNGPGGGGPQIEPPPGDTGLTPASVGVARIGRPSAQGTSVTVDQMCVGPPSDPCSLVFIISQNEYVTGFPGSRPNGSAAEARKPRKRKPKAVILGKKTVTLHGGERRKVTIKLNRAGKKLLKKRGKLKLYFTATQKGAPGERAKRLKAVRVTFKTPR